MAHCCPVCIKARQAILQERGTAAMLSASAATPPRCEKFQAPTGCVACYRSVTQHCRSPTHQQVRSNAAGSGAKSPAIYSSTRLQDCMVANTTTSYQSKQNTHTVTCFVHNSVLQPQRRASNGMHTHAIPAAWIQSQRPDTHEDRKHTDSAISHSQHSAPATYHQGVVGSVEHAVGHLCGGRCNPQHCPHCDSTDTKRLVNTV